MKFGFCIGGDANEISLAEKAGADYVETAFDMLARDDGTGYDAFAVRRSPPSRSGPFLYQQDNEGKAGRRGCHCDHGSRAHDGRD